MGSIKPAFNLKGAASGGILGSNGLAKNPSLTNIIAGGMQKKPAGDSTTTNPYNGTPYTDGNTLISGVDKKPTDNGL